MINTILYSIGWFVFCFVVFKIISKNTKNSLLLSGAISVVVVSDQLLVNLFSISLPRYVYDLAAAALLLITVNFLKKPN
jgi:hypothetical protein